MSSTPVLSTCPLARPSPARLDAASSAPTSSSPTVTVRRAWAGGAGEGASRSGSRSTRRRATSVRWRRKRPRYGPGAAIRLPARLTARSTARQLWIHRAGPIRQRGHEPATRTARPPTATRSCCTGPNSGCRSATGTCSRLRPGRSSSTERQDLARLPMAWALLPIARHPDAVTPRPERQLIPSGRRAARVTVLSEGMSMNSGTTRAPIGAGVSSTHSHPGPADVCGLTRSRRTPNATFRIFSTVFTSNPAALGPRVGPSCCG